MELASVSKMSTRVNINSVVDEWFSRQLQQRQIPDMQNDTSSFDLAAAGLLDSFAIVELLVGLSSNSELDVDENKLNIDSCRTLVDLKAALEEATTSAA